MLARADRVQICSSAIGYTDARLFDRNLRARSDREKQRKQRHQQLDSRMAAAATRRGGQKSGILREKPIDARAGCER
jgi:hypothetical protein